jgi:putative two-component system response regulator
MPESIAGPHAASEGTLGRRGRATRILVVDDEPLLRELLATTLSNAGYRVHAACDALDALNALRNAPRNAPFDCVLSDVKMPGMDGIELTEYVAENYPGTPIILISGHADHELVRQAIRRGASDFITKPFQTGTLSFLIEKNLERVRMERLRTAEQDYNTRFKVIQALAAAIDAKTSYTAEHSRRVTLLSRAMGEAMDFNPADLRLLEMAAQVHDVGKIGVPDRILNKKSELSAGEWEVMRTHPAQGAEIVGQVPELLAVAEVVLHHHERVDGSGYPDGLRGEAIPLLSRVISVADAYESMTSDRAYRAAMQRTEAISRLKDGSGTQFDHAIVKAFVSLHEGGQLHLSLA